MTPKEMKIRLIPFLKGIIEDEGSCCDVNWEVMLSTPLFQEVCRSLGLFTTCVQGLSRKTANPSERKEVL